jgi:hypothetical protein
MKIPKEENEIIDKLNITIIAKYLVLLDTSDPDEWEGRVYDLNQAIKEIKKECLKLMKDDTFLYDNFYND